MDSSNLFKHVVDLYDTKPVTRKEYLIVLLLFSLITLFSYAVLFDAFLIVFIFVILFLFASLLLIATFNRLKNTIISSTPAFILSFLIPYLLLVLYVSTIGLEMNIPLENYIRNTALVYFILLFLTGLILPAANKNKEITDENNKKLNLLHIFNDLITLNLKASINRVQYIISFIAAFTAPAFMVYLSYLLIKLLRLIYRYSLEAENVYKFNFFSPEMVILIISIEIIFAITILLIFLLFIMRLNDITKNFYVKLFIITSYIILIAAAIFIAAKAYYDIIVLIPVFKILLFIIPAFIKGKSAKAETI